MQAFALPRGDYPHYYILRKRLQEDKPSLVNPSTEPASRTATSLADLAILDRYRSDHDDLVTQLYLPCLKRSKIYSRGVGFFTSKSITLAIDGVQVLVNRGGTMRLVVSPVLTQEDIRAINEGYEKRETIVERALIRGISETSSEGQDPHLCFLSWLVANSHIDIKVAISSRGNGIGTYHEKIGLFQDEFGNTVAFTGSANETMSGLVGNFERMDVFRSWDAGDARRIPSLVADYESLWTNTTPGLIVVPFPEAARSQLLRLAPPTYHDFSLSPDYDKRLAPFHLIKIEPKERQLEATRAWKAASFRGILEMATGTGKSIAALTCAANLTQLNLLVVAVPTIELANQWLELISNVTDLNLPISAFGESNFWLERFFRKLSLMNHEQVPRSELPLVVVGLYGALSSKKVDGLISDAGGLPLNSLLIADEVHNAGASTYQNTLRVDYAYRLGLSATPIRKYDEPGNNVIGEYFAGTVYTFSIGDAIASGVLSPYDYSVYPVELETEEFDEYVQLSKRIAATQSSPSTLDDEFRKRLLIKRAAIIKSASNKERVLLRIADENSLRRALVYAADIEEATRYSSILTKTGLRVARYSSEDPKRGLILREFARDRLDVLVSINCLDEGVDLPDARMAVIVASDSSERQFIQRRGRVLRIAAGKENATIIDILVLPPVQDSRGSSLFRSEISRVAEFSRYARNTMSVKNQLIKTLELYGYSPSETLRELGQ